MIGAWVDLFMAWYAFSWTVLGHSGHTARQGGGGALGRWEVGGGGASEVGAELNILRFER